jgi:hypothetical protein
LLFWEKSLTRIPERFLTTITTFVLFASLSFGSAIIPGFNATSDGRNDDGTYTTGGCNNNSSGGTCSGTLVPIGFYVNFFGLTTNSLYINTNGNVTFDAPLSTPTPFPLIDGFSQIIAPFFADVDTRNPAGGVVTFGNGTFGGFNAFGVNWIDVGYNDQQANKLNSFQLLLVNRSDTGVGNFDIVFNYDRILWEAGDASFGTDGLGGFSAVVGFSDGTGDPANTFELPGSCVPGSFIDGGPDALATTGRYIFDARDGAIAVTPEPRTSVLLVAGSVLLLLYRRTSRRQGSSLKSM